MSIHTGVSITLLPMNKRFWITQYYVPGSNSIEKVAQATTRVAHSQWRLRGVALTLFTRMQDIII
jgi:hypothetical protein